MFLSLVHLIVLFALKDDSPFQAEMTQKMDKNAWKMQYIWAKNNYKVQLHSVKKRK